MQDCVDSCPWAERSSLLTQTRDDEWVPRWRASLQNWSICHYGSIWEDRDKPGDDARNVWKSQPVLADLQGRVMVRGISQTTEITWLPSLASKKPASKGFHCIPHFSIMRNAQYRWRTLEVSQDPTPHVFRMRRVFHRSHWQIEAVLQLPSSESKTKKKTQPAESSQQKQWDIPSFFHHSSSAGGAFSRYSLPFSLSQLNL